MRRITLYTATQNRQSAAAAAIYTLIFSDLYPADVTMSIYSLKLLRIFRNKAIQCVTCLCLSNLIITFISKYHVS